MQTKSTPNHGIERMIKRCRNQFQRTENEDYYAMDDYRAAERKFIKFCLIHETGSIEEG